MSLAYIRARQATYLPDSARVLRKVTSSDGMGGRVVTWATAATVACRLAAASGAERVIGERITPSNTYTVTMPYGTDVRQADRVEVTVGSAAARLFEVAALLSGSNETARRVLCTEVL